VTLSDYRIRYATYRTDEDLQDAHARHPFIAVWDDHEITDDAWSGGAKNHNPDEGEGDWATRQAAAYRAYLEWMPIRESGEGIHLYRSFRFGSLAHLVMLDTRGLRDQQVPGNDLPGLVRESRTLLGAAQERWLFDQLHSSQRAGSNWRIIGQQVMFSRLALPGRPILLSDGWDDYQAARDRVVDFIASERIRDVAILSGDIHSSWGFNVPKNAWDGYNAATGDGSLAVEIVAPAISSVPLFADPLLHAGEPGLRASLPHLKFLEGESNGYVLLDITRQRLQSDWYFVPTVAQHSDEQKLAISLVCERGSSRLLSS
jgi:alkaline phosphatase D